MTEIQRARMLTAMVRVVGERGAGNVSVAHVVGQAGVSRRTFYEVFADCEDCLQAAFEEGVTRAAACVMPVYRTSDPWRSRIRGSLSALLCLFDEDRATARLLVVESLSAGRRLLERRARIVRCLTQAVQEGAGEQKMSGQVTSLTAEGIVGAVLGIVYGRLAEGNPAPLVGLVNPLMSMIVLPYLGPAAARKELSRHQQAPVKPAEVIAGDPLKDLEMRLTYRTVRMLSAVEANRGQSNRMIGEIAGITDQGQASKLLARLEKLGLIENFAPGAIRGEPNAWTLTKRGQEVHHTLSARAGAG